jgi:hypothetical protein
MAAPKTRLGKLRKLGLREMKEIWPREEADLSPWIADNVESLNEVLTLQIQIEGREENVHNFRLDLVGTDNASQMPVVIENQFGESDHDHLGKLITYAAGRDAGILIWIANNMQIAHRNAVDWLNRISPPEMRFYGVDLEVFRIDESAPAPNFRVVAGPPRPPSTGGISPRNKRYQKFFSSLRAEVLAIQPGFTRAKALPQSWWSLGIGRSGFSLSCAFTVDSKFRVEVYIDTGRRELNDLAFGALKEEAPQIEREIGADLVWDPLPDSRASRIYSARDGTIDESDETLGQVTQWAAPLLARFREVFLPRIKNLQLDE